MPWPEQIVQELAKASKGLEEGNDGLARVCARRAVALAGQHRFEQQILPAWQGDAMQQLRQIREETRFPLSVREASQRLMTKITEQSTSPMTTDPITDAQIILEHLNHGT